MFTLLVILLAVWFVLSVQVIGPNEVAIRLFFGKPDESERYGAGWIFVPWIPVKFSGHKPFELVRIPTKQFPFHYRGGTGDGDDNQVWSKDKQLLVVEVSGYVRLPYDEPKSLVSMITAGVPLTEKELEKWMRQEVVAGLRDIMAGFTLAKCIRRSNLEAINAAAKAYFLRPEGLFAKSGICGNDPENYEEGTGEVILRVEQVNPTQELQAAMGAPVVAKYLADAARAEAERQAILISDALKIAMQEWVAGQKKADETLEQATERLKVDGSYGRHASTMKDFILAQGGNLNVDRIEVCGANGGPLEGDLSPAVALFRAAFGNKGPSRRRDKSRNPSKAPEEMSGEELSDWADREKKGSKRDD